jgi:hypothetical protein
MKDDSQDEAQPNFASPHSLKSDAAASPDAKQECVGGLPDQPAELAAFVTTSPGSTACPQPPLLLP